MRINPSLPSFFLTFSFATASNWNWISLRCHKENISYSKRLIFEGLKKGIYMKSSQILVGNIKPHSLGYLSQNQLRQHCKQIYICDAANMQGPLKIGLGGWTAWTRFLQNTVRSASWIQTTPQKNNISSSNNHPKTLGKTKNANQTT